MEKYKPSGRSDTILVCFDWEHGIDKAVLAVGRRRPNHTVEVINAFAGDEAIEIYRKLIEKKEKPEEKGDDKTRED